MHPEIPLLAQITRLRFQRIHTLLHPFALHPSQYHLLAILSQEDGINQKHLAAKLYVKPSTLTIMIMRLSKGEYVERRRSSQDKRQFSVHITQKGKDVLQKAKKALSQIEEETFLGFTEEEKTLFSKMAQRMKDNLISVVEKEREACHWF